MHFKKESKQQAIFSYIAFISHKQTNFLLATVYKRTQFSTRIVHHHHHHHHQLNGDIKDLFIFLIQPI